MKQENRFNKSLIKFDRLGMKKYILLLSLIISTQIYASPWEELYAPGVEKMLKHTNYKNVFSSFLKNDGNYNISDFDSDLYIKALPETKKILHQIMRIKDWTIENASPITFQENNKKGITISGSYISHKGNKVQFIETHIFTSSSFLQYQLLVPKDERESVQLLSNYKSIFEQELGLKNE